MLQHDNIPVLLLTGYLGSGKTTLLNRILSNRKGIRFAVIVNDIGEVNIDAELIQKGGVVAQQDDSLIALQNGCICCSLKMDLVQQLRDLCVTNNFDYIVIEASGICEPAPIAQTICSYSSLSPHSLVASSPILYASHFFPHTTNRLSLIACPLSDVPAARKVICLPSLCARAIMACTSCSLAGCRTSCGIRR